jgi:hypothetical protein
MLSQLLSGANKVVNALGLRTKAFIAGLVLRRWMEEKRIFKQEKRILKQEKRIFKQEKFILKQEKRMIEQ